VFLIDKNFSSHKISDFESYDETSLVVNGLRVGLGGGLGLGVAAHTGRSGEATFKGSPYTGTNCCQGLASQENNNIDLVKLKPSNWLFKVA